MIHSIIHLNFLYQMLLTLINAFRKSAIIQLMPEPGQSYQAHDSDKNCLTPNFFEVNDDSLTQQCFSHALQYSSDPFDLAPQMSTPVSCWHYLSAIIAWHPQPVCPLLYIYHLSILYYSYVHHDEKFCFTVNLMLKSFASDLEAPNRITHSKWSLV